MTYRKRAYGRLGIACRRWLRSNRLRTISRPYASSSAKPSSRMRQSTRQKTSCVSLPTVTSVAGTNYLQVITAQATDLDNEPNQVEIRICVGSRVKWVSNMFTWRDPSRSVSLKYGAGGNTRLSV
jgi:hypothetical protein